MVLYQNGCMDRADCQHRGFFQAILHLTVKTLGISLWKFVPNSGLKTLPPHVNHHKVLSTQFNKDGRLCDKLDHHWCNYSTTFAPVNVSPTTSAMQFITLSLYLCVQHNAQEVARHVDPPATADTYLTYQ